MTRGAGIVLAAVLVGCPSDDVPEPTPLVCGAGSLLDGESCVPDACGTGAWGALDLADAVLVAPGGSGSGTSADPFGSIQAAVDAAAEDGGGRVAIAAGTYRESLELVDGHPLVIVAGRCAELVVIDGRAGEAEQRPAVHWRGGQDRLQDVTVSGGAIGLLFEADAGSIATPVVERVRVDGALGKGALASGRAVAPELRDVVVTGTRRSGVQDEIAMGIQAFDGAGLTLQNVRIEDNLDVGLRVQGETTIVVATGVTVRRTRMEDNRSGGVGITVDSGALFTGLDVVSEDNELAGMMVFEADASVTRGSFARNRSPRPDVIGGGVAAFGTGGALLTDCVLEDNLGLGISARDGAEVVVQRGEVRRTSEYAEEQDGGFGIWATEGAVLRATGTLIEDNVTFGAAVAGVGTLMELVDVTVRGTHPGLSGVLGRGVSVACPPDDPACSPTLVMDGGLVEANHDGGVGAVGAGATATLEGVTIRGTRPLPAWGTSGWGLVASEGATVEGLDLVVDSNHEVGVAAIGVGSRVSLVGGEVRGTRGGVVGFGGLGLATQPGAELVAEGTVVVDGAGPGALAIGGTIRLTDVTLERNRFAGVVVAQYGTVQLSGGAIRGTMPSHVFGGGVGVCSLAMGGVPTVLLTGAEFEDLPGPALYVAGPGDVEMADCAVRDAGGPSVPGGVLAVRTGTWPSSLRIAETTLRGLAGDAVLLSAASAELDTVRFEDVGGAPLGVQDCDGIEPPRLVDTDADPTCGPYRFDVDPELDFDFSLAEVSVEE